MKSACRFGLPMLRTAPLPSIWVGVISSEHDLRVFEAMPDPDAATLLLLPRSDRRSTRRASHCRPQRLAQP
jgi:hypothetical protein